MANSLSAQLNEAVIHRLADAQSYQQGREYFANGHVESLEDRGDGVRALVRGTVDYTVTLGAAGGLLDYSCDCPVGRDGDFCKHCVAAALAWLHRENSSPATSTRRDKAKEVTLADAGQALVAEDKEALVRMLLDWAQDDQRLHDRLLQYAARRNGAVSAIAAANRAFQQAAGASGPVPYREAEGWARGVGHAIDSFDLLLHDGQAAAVVELCESGLRSLISSIEIVDDSDGYFSALRDRLQDIHLRACREARLDQVELATRLFQWELRADFDVFAGAAERYAKILGATGMQAYRELAQAEWAKVPARAAEPERSGWGRHFRITQIMESLARASGDLEELVTVMSRDLSSAYSYWRIAELYREAREHDRALAWAEKGLAAFPERTDNRLRELAAEEYHHRRRHDEAMKLMWTLFSERPLLESFKTLERHATKAGAWPAWRERALAEIRSRIAQDKQQARGPARHRWTEAGGSHSPLVEVFLYEDNAGEAWREAVEGGCSDTLWLRLAAAREREYPQDAAPIYLKQAEAAIATTTNSRYEDSVNLLIKAAALMKRMNRGPEFVRQLEALRAKYKIKRNFNKLVEQQRKSLYV